MTYKLEWEPRGIYWEYSGNVTGDEILEASTRIYGDHRFDDIRYKLVNFLNADTIDIEEDEVNMIAFQHKAASISNSRIKTAIVIHPHTTMSRNNSAKLELFITNLATSSWEVEVFNDLQKANIWLGRKDKI
ncbi:MAG: hypothetical protein OQL09_01945 [Gammaproteobacteria bacterium]|nr:hypothetical protein [Gammaproteobacteria bacterium]